VTELNEFEYISCDENILQVLLEGPKWTNEIQRKTKKNKRYVMNQLGLFLEKGLVCRRLDKNKVFFELTPKGKDACAYYKIRREAGYSGNEWASKMLERGYNVRFLSDFTRMDSHKRWLFAWNPSTRDVDMALIFGTKSVSREGASSAYIAQYVDREKNPKEPIRHNVLFDFVKNSVKDFNNEEQMAKALKTFWDPDTHNSFICVLLPENVSFGIPREIGHFNSMVFMGVGHQESFPFIPKMDFAAGSVDLGKNFRVNINYSINLIGQHILLWLLLKKQLDAPNDPAERQELERMIMEAERHLYGEMVKPKVVCKHGTADGCRKMGIKCVALERGEVDARKCPILMDEIRKYPITFERINDLSSSISSSTEFQSG